MSETTDILKARAEGVRDETRTSRNTAKCVGQLLYDIIDQTPDLDELKSLFLSKVGDDVAAGRITFEQGLTALAKAYFTDIEASGDVVSSDFDYADELGSGWGLFKTQGGNSKLTVDQLFVRQVATFMKLDIRELSYVGGNIVLSSAASEISEVEEVYNLDGELVGWKCSWVNDDGTTATTNSWMAGDQARCQTFDIAPGVYENVSNKYYWRLVTEVGENYVVLSATDRDDATDNDIPSCRPQKGDKLVQMGYRLGYNATEEDETDASNSTRCSLMMLSANGEDAPCIKGYGGVVSYSLSEHQVFKISPYGCEFDTQYFNITYGGIKYPSMRYMGDWSEGAHANYYELWQYGGCSWLCVSADGTTNEPSDTSADWVRTTGQPDSLAVWDIVPSSSLIRYSKSGENWTPSPKYISCSLRRTTASGAEILGESDQWTEYGVTLYYYYTGEEWFAYSAHSGQVVTLEDGSEAIELESYSESLELEEAQGGSGVIYPFVRYDRIYLRLVEDSTGVILAEGEVPLLWDGEDGTDGADGADGKDGVDGKDGKSAWTARCNTMLLSTDSKGEVQYSGNYFFPTAAHGDTECEVTAIKVNSVTPYKGDAVEWTEDEDTFTATATTSNGKPCVRVTDIIHRYFLADGTEVEKAEAVKTTGYFAVPWMHGIAYCTLAATDPDTGETAEIDIALEWQAEASAHWCKWTQDMYGFESVVGQMQGDVDAMKLSVSTIRQTAEDISLKVDDLTDDLAATGIDIEKGKITLTADNVTFNSNQGDLMAVINGDGITAKSVICTDSSGNLKSSLNEFGDGSLIQYYSSGNKQMEFGNGYITYYNDDDENSVAWQIGIQGPGGVDNATDWVEYSGAKVDFSTGTFTSQKVWMFRAGTSSEYYSYNGLYFSSHGANNAPTADGNTLASGCYALSTDYLPGGMIPTEYSNCYIGINGVKVAYLRYFGSFANGKKGTYGTYSGPYDYGCCYSDNKTYLGKLSEAAYYNSETGKYVATFATASQT